MKESLTPRISPQRNYGIDLLRLISMFMVVVLHVLGKGGILDHTQSLSPKGEVLWFLEIFCYCAVNVFAIISGVVGLKAKHKYSNLIYLSLQLILYSVLITGVDVAISIYNGTGIVLKDVILNLLPSVRALWYFSAYFCLFFFMPMLNSIVEHTPRNALRIGAAFVFVVFCCFGQISTKIANLNNGYSVLWLAILYLFGAYISKYNLFNNVSLYKAGFGFLACILLTSLSRLVLGNIGKNINILVSYTSPTILLSAIFLVVLFKNIKLGNKATKTVAFLSPMAFGVYLIHCHPIVIQKILNDAYIWVALKPIYLAPLIVIGIAFAIYATCLFIDWLRILLFKVCKVKNFSIWLENTLGKIATKLLSIFHIKTTSEQNDTQIE